MSSSHILAKKYGLAPREQTLVLATMGTPVVSEDDMMCVIWPDVDAMPDTWADILRIVVWRANQKLKLHGWRVRKSWNGFRLENAS